MNPSPYLSDEGNKYRVNAMSIKTKDRFKILKAPKCKCPRCWKYRSKSEEELCHRCAEALNG